MKPTGKKRNGSASRLAPARKRVRPKPDNALKQFNRSLEEAEKKHYVLRLYVAGSSSRSMRAIENLRKICDEHLKDRYTLEVVDIYQQQDLAKSANIIAAPTLIKALPLPLRKMIGDMASTDRMLVGLDLRQK